MQQMLHQIIALVNTTKNKQPLIHCLTNPLTANDCANIILTVGAKPIMAQHLSEIEEVTTTAKALMINIGGITDERIKAIFLSGKTAKAHGIPIIFDAVGAAGSSFRLSLSLRILNELQPQIIKGNMSEIKALSGLATDAVGVDASLKDSITADNLADFADIVQSFAKRWHAVAVATGKTDIIAQQNSVYLVPNGHPMLAQLTGTGCMGTSLIAAYCYSKDYLTAATAASLCMGIAGELAAEASGGIGSFKTSLFDYLYHLSDEIINKRSKLYVHT